MLASRPARTCPAIGARENARAIARARGRVAPIRRKGSPVLGPASWLGGSDATMGKRNCVAASFNEDDPWGEGEAEDDSEKAFKWLYAAMYRWNRSDLAEYKNDEDPDGKTSLIKSANAIREFAGVDLKKVERSLRSQIEHQYNKAEDSFDSYAEIVNGVAIASTTASAASVAFLAVPGIGPLVSAGVTVADAIQQAATQPETLKRYGNWQREVGALSALDFNESHILENYNSALADITGVYESPSQSVSNASRGMMMALILSKDLDVPFEEFMDSLSEDFVNAFKNKEETLRKVEEFDATAGGDEINITALGWIKSMEGINDALFMMALAFVGYYQFSMIKAANAGQPPPGRVIVRFARPSAVNAARTSAGGQSFAGKFRSASKLAGVLGLVALGLDIARLVNNIKDFKKVRKDFKESRGEAIGVISEFVTDLQTTQELFE